MCSTPIDFALSLWMEFLTTAKSTTIIILGTLQAGFNTGFRHYLKLEQT